MRTSATHLPIWGGSAPLAAALMLAFACPAQAQDKEKKEEPAKPITEQSVNAGDVAATPIEDLNLKKDEIPPLLLEAQRDPYDTTGLKRCNQYIAAVSELDAVLGPDFDVAGQAERKATAGSVAKSVVGSFIPFRGLIREITGANKHQQQFQDAILAGMARRAYLKGMGAKLGCRYPARPADDHDRARLAAEAEQAAALAEAEKKKD